jgi:hypothetical protein
MIARFFYYVIVTERNLSKNQKQSRSFLFLCKISILSASKILT